MNPRSTWWWVALAAALFAFIFFFERHWPGPNPAPAAEEKLLPGFRPATVTGLRVRREGQFVRLERLEDGWRLTAPMVYPAQPVLVEALLKAIAGLDRQSRITSTALADFGLADPQANVLVQQGAAQTELHVGNNTPAGDQVYVRVVGQDAIYAVDAGFLDQIPLSANDWRSRALLSSSKSFDFDRLEVRAAARGLGFALHYNPTNKIWRLAKPMQARADRPKVEQLLLKVLSGRISRFVSDNPATDPEPFGLQPPELELALGADTNDLLVVQFGKSPTNDPTQVYARLMHQTNVVLAPKDLMEALRVPFTDLRERRLLAFAPGAVSHIEARGGEGFVLQRQPDASWRVSEPQDLPADTTLLRELFSDLLSLEAVEFEKDVVTDFATYGLVAPLRQFLLKTTLTNASGATNVLVAQINFGTNGAGKLFAHRPDENSVYAVRETDYLRLPAAGWQLRERQLWNFSVTNVIRVTITQGGRTHQLVRTGADDWTFGPGSQGLIREVSLERTMARLGTLQAAAWVARGVEHRARYGFTNDGHQMAIELKTGDKTQTLTLEFGGQSKSLNPYAAVTLEGQAWIFEFPWVVYQDVLRDLTIPKLPGERPGA